MSTSNLALAETYYTAMREKDISRIEQCLHPHVRFKGSLAELTGREAVLDGAKKFFTIFKTLRIRATFADGDQVMLAYDLDCPMPVGLLRVAALITFKNHLITDLELFYDGRPFEQKQKAQ